MNINKTSESARMTVDTFDCPRISEAQSVPYQSYCVRYQYLSLRSGEAPLAYYIDITSRDQLPQVQFIPLLQKLQSATHPIHLENQNAPLIPYLQLSGAPIAHNSILFHNHTADEARPQRPGRPRNWSNRRHWRCDSAFTRKPWLLGGTTL